MCLSGLELGTFTYESCALPDCASGTLISCRAVYLFVVWPMGGATFSPERPGPHQILNKMTGGPHQN